MNSKRKRLILKWGSLPIILSIVVTSLMSFTFIDVTQGTGGKYAANTQREFTDIEKQDLTDGVFSYVKQWNNKKVNNVDTEKNIRYQYFYTLQNTNKDATFKVSSDEISIRRVGESGINGEIWITFFNQGEYDYTKNDILLQRKWLNKLLEHYSSPITNIVIPYEYNRMNSDLKFVELYDGSTNITSENFNPSVDGENFPYYSLTIYDEVGITTTPASGDNYLTQHHTSIISFRLKPMKMRSSSEIVPKTLQDSTYTTTSLSEYTSDNTLNDALKYIIRLLKQWDVWNLEKNASLNDAKTTYEVTKNEYLQLNKGDSDYQQKQQAYFEAYENYFKTKKAYDGKNLTSFKWGNVDENGNEDLVSGQELFANLLDKLLISFLKDSAAYKNEEFDTKKQYLKDSDLVFSGVQKD